MRGTGITIQTALEQAESSYDLETVSTTVNRHTPPPRLS